MPISEHRPSLPEVYRSIKFSQVVLSLQLSFAVIPLVMFTSNRRLMGNFVNPFWLKTLSWIVTIIIVGLNVWLLLQTFLGWLFPSQ